MKCLHAAESQDGLVHEASSVRAGKLKHILQCETTDVETPWRTSGVCPGGKEEAGI